MVDLIFDIVNDYYKNKTIEKSVQEALEKWFQYAPVKDVLARSEDIFILGQPNFFSRADENFNVAILKTVSDLMSRLADDITFGEALDLYAELKDLYGDNIAPAGGFANLKRLFKKMEVYVAPKLYEEKFKDVQTLRRGRHEITLTERKLPTKLKDFEPVKPQNLRIRHDYHIHTNYSDGRSTMAEYIAYIRTAYTDPSLGGQLPKALGFSDHGPSLAISWKPFSTERQLEAREELDNLQLQNPDLCLRLGIELDMSYKGTDRLVPEDPSIFDYFIIAQHHPTVRKDATRMIIDSAKALLPYAPVILAHPQPQRMDENKGNYMAIDWGVLASDLSKEKFYIELSGAPYILGIMEQSLEIWRRHDGKFVLSSDAHAVDELTMSEILARNFAATHFIPEDSFAHI
jgi:histidinol phosphatase-like PHP family hydrolase